MKLERLELWSFGKFQNRSIELSDGINLFCAENEAGKSTIMHLSKVCCSMWNGAGGEVLPKMRFINMSRGEIPPSTAG